MQDKYAGDVGDFGKFVLLRRLSQTSGRPLRLGINWYRTTRAKHASNDGRHIAYLQSRSQFRDCDPSLYGKLQNVVNNRRSVEAIEQAQMLPTKTLFYTTPVPFGSTDLAQRIADRERWFEESLRQLLPADLLFLDPDNGIQTPKVKKTQYRAIKYAFIDELQRYLSACNFIIVYNHQGRLPPERRAQRFATIRDELGQSVCLRVLRFKRVSVRYYALFYKREFASEVHRLCAALAAPPCDFLFEEFKLH